IAGGNTTLVYGRAEPSIDRAGVDRTGGIGPDDPAQHGAAGAVRGVALESTCIVEVGAVTVDRAVLHCERSIGNVSITFAAYTHALRETGDERVPDLPFGAVAQAHAVVRRAIVRTDQGDVADAWIAKRGIVEVRFQIVGLDPIVPGGRILLHHPELSFPAPAMRPIEAVVAVAGGDRPFQVGRAAEELETIIASLVGLQMLQYGLAAHTIEAESVQFIVRPQDLSGVLHTHVLQRSGVIVVVRSAVYTCSAFTL